MRSLRRVLTLGIMVGLANVVALAGPARAAGGPVVLMGIDAEDGGPGGHGPVTVYQSVINSGILTNTSNGGAGILVIGGGKSAGDNVTAFWNAVGAGTAPVTYVNGAAAIAAQSFAGFRMLAVASDLNNTPSGGLTQAENDALAARQSDVATFVNLGGGLMGLSQTGLSASSRYAYLGGVGTFTFNFPAQYSNITATPAGVGVGISNTNLDVCCWHDEYLTFPAFLSVLATNVATGNAAAIGGANVVVPTAISLTPPTATNPVGSPHTLTASVVDNNGQPLGGVLVTFSVTGANAGAAGTCAPPNCTTGANGQVSFTYTGSNVGNDSITACFTSQTGSMICTSASKTWFSPVTIAVNDVTVNEGDAGFTPATFTVSLSQPAPAGGVTVLASTANGTATAPSDYVARSNVLVPFAAGETSKPFTVQVVGDLVDEPTENYVVNLTSPTNATIADGQGLGTIVDDDRNGKFSCRASALRLVGQEPVVANGPDVPCKDAAATAVTATLTSGSVNVSSRTLNASTDQTPDDLETTAPAATDTGVARSSVEQATATALGVSITTRDVVSEARVRCVAAPGGGLTPALTSSSSLASLTINGVAVDVNGSATITLPAGLGTVQINRTVTTPTSVTQQAVRIVLLGREIVIAEARADFTGNPCAQ